MSIQPSHPQSVMPSSHLVLCHPLLLLPPILPSIRVFSNESTLCMRWPKYWSFSFNISFHTVINLHHMSLRFVWECPTRLSLLLNAVSSFPLESVAGCINSAQCIQCSSMLQHASVFYKMPNNIPQSVIPCFICPFISLCTLGSPYLQFIFSFYEQCHYDIHM